MKPYQRIKDRFVDAAQIIRDCYEEGREDTETSKITAFIQCGLFVLSVILISGIAISYGQDRFREQSVTTSTTSIATTAGGYSKSEKKLPIYCVDTDEKKVALSFDAAWVAGRLLEDSILL